MNLIYYAPSIPDYSPINFEEGSDIYGTGFHFSGHIKSAIGVDPESTGIIALNQLGVYPAIVPTIQPFNPDFTIAGPISSVQYVVPDHPNHIAPHVNNFEEYSTAPGGDFDKIVWYNQEGEYAVVTGYVPLFKSDSGLSDIGKKRLQQFGFQVLRNRRTFFANDKWSLSDPTSSTVADYWRSANNDFLDYIKAKVDSLTESMTAEQVNAIVSPAMGRVLIIRDKNNENRILTVKFNSFYGYHLSEFGVEFHFPATNTTLPYELAEGIQPGAVDLLSADDTRVQIRRVDTGVIIDELDLYEADSLTLAELESTDFSDAVAEDPDFGSLGFGFYKYYESLVSPFPSAVDVETLTDVADIIRRHSEDPEFGDSLTVGENASLKFESNIVKLENLLRGTSVNIGNNIEVRPAAAGGRLEVSGDLILDGSDLTEAADDTAAAAAGVQLGQVYHNAGVLRVRIS